MTPAGSRRVPSHFHVATQVSVPRRSGWALVSHRIMCATSRCRGVSVCAVDTLLTSVLHVPFAGLSAVQRLRICSIFRYRR